MNTPLPHHDYPANNLNVSDYPDLFEEDGTPLYVRTVDGKLDSEPSFEAPGANPIHAFHDEQRRQDSGARLDSPETHRNKTVEKIAEATRNALGATESGIAWSTKNGYHPEVTVKLEEARAMLLNAQELIDIFEDR